jgi:hypothetical protein
VPEKLRAVNAISRAQLAFPAIFSKRCKIPTSAASPTSGSYKKTLIKPYEVNNKLPWWKIEHLQPNTECLRKRSSKFRLQNNVLESQQWLAFYNSKRKYFQLSYCSNSTQIKTNFNRIETRLCFQDTIIQIERFTWHIQRRIGSNLEQRLKCKTSN